jgi:hypothetical protein
MEAVYLEGFGDGSAPVQQLDPIEPTKSGREEAARFAERAEAGRNVDSRIVDPVMNIIDGFEGAYSIELLASTHWVATNEGSRTPHEAWAAIQEWTARKARLFTEAHVAAAWRKLESVGAITSSR